MKNLFLKSALPFALIVLTLAVSCAKYEDGPSFTLATKKAPAGGCVKAEKFDGATVATPLLHEFKSDGTYKRTITILGVDIVYDGTWEFTADKEKLTLNIQGAYEDMIITRLTSDEFWYKDSSGKVWEMIKQ